MFRTEPEKSEILGVPKNASQDRKAAIMEKLKELAQANSEKFERKNEDTVVPLIVSLADLYTGKTKTQLFSRYAYCIECKSKGSKSGATIKCSGCQGSGMKYIISKGMCRCFQCKGTGETISETITDEDRCDQCKGEKVVREKDSLKVHVEKGMQDGQKITFTREVVKSIGGGGMVVILQQEEHPKFKRNGDDLFVEHALSLKEALCGYEFELTHLDTRKITVKSQPGEVVKPGEVKVIDDEGMPIYQRSFLKGKLYIHFTVEFDSLTPDQRNAIQDVLLAPIPSAQQTDVEVDDLKIEMKNMEIGNGGRLKGGGGDC